MTRPWVAIVVGLCGLFTLVVAVNHFSDNGTDSGEAPMRMASLAGKPAPEQGGWSGRPVPGGSRGKFETSGGSSSALGSTGGTSRGGNTYDAGRGSALTAGSGSRRSGGVLGRSGSSAPSFGGNSIRLAAPDEPAVRFEGGGNRMIGGSGSQTVSQGNQRGPTGNGDTSHEKDAPVLSLSFDGSLDPEKGEAPVVAEGVTFDSGAGATFATDSQYVIPDAGSLVGDAGTISFQIQPDWAGSDAVDASLVQLRDPNQWQNRIQITKNGQYLRFLFTDNTGVESGAGVAIANWQPGDNHQITATWGDQVASLYVDGRLVGQGNFDGQFQPQPTTPLHIGSDFPGGQPGAQATMSNFQLYNNVHPPQ